MIARVARMHDLKAVALDVTFDRVTNRPGAMDLTTESGFAFLTCTRLQSGVPDGSVFACP